MAKLTSASWLATILTLSMFAGCENRHAPPSVTQSPQATKASVASVEPWPNSKSAMFAKNSVVSMAMHFFDTGENVGLGVDWKDALGIDYRLRADKIITDYSDNEISADQKYKDKKIVILGRISQIGKDIAGNGFLTLQGSAGDFRTVHATILSSETSDASKLHKDQNTALVCVVNGLYAGSVAMDRCYFLEHYKANTALQLNRIVDQIMAGKDPDVAQLTAMKLLALVGYIAAMRDDSGSCLNESAVDQDRCSKLIEGAVASIKANRLSESERSAARHMNIDLAEIRFH